TSAASVVPCPIAGPIGCGWRLALGPLAQQGIAHRLHFECETMPERTCDVLDHFGHAIAQAVAGVEGAGVVPRCPRRCSVRPARFFTHRHAATETEQHCRRQRENPGCNPSLPHDTCPLIRTTALATRLAEILNLPPSRSPILKGAA